MWSVSGHCFVVDSTHNAALPDLPEWLKSEACEKVDISNQEQTDLHKLGPVAAKWVYNYNLTSCYQITSIYNDLSYNYNDCNSTITIWLIVWYFDPIVKFYNLFT